MERVISCGDCGNDITIKNGNQKYCAACRKARAAANVKAYQLKLRKTPIYEKCQHCNEAPPKNAKAQFCDPCGKLRRKDSWTRWYSVPENKAKVREYSSEHEARTRFKRGWELKQKYGITLEEHDQLLEDFNHSCGICGADKDLCVDHCHSSGVVRGILCRKCNLSIGQLGDSAEMLFRAFTYLKEHSPNAA